MAAEKDEDLADFINEETDFFWDDIKDDLPEYPTEALIEIMVELGLYVNKTLAQEIAKREDAVFYLRKLLQYGKHWRSGGPGDGWSPLHAIHILALIKSRESFELLLDIIRYHEDDLGNWVTEDASSLLVAFGEDFVEPIKEFTNDETLETFVRLAATSALAALGKKFPRHQDDIKKHLTELLKTTHDGTFAGLVAHDLASFHDPSVIPDIRRAFEDGIIDDPFIPEDEVVAAINGVFSDMDARDFKRNTADPLNHFSRENIESLHMINYDEDDEDDDEFEAEIDSVLKDDYSEPAMEEIKPKEIKIGRNNPCPCGSGKKYKKCCMGKEKS
ncbi:MAG: DUF1186 domain-containing protein [Euryarchaeota archaeon]|nr:DUF1186 domain-containing protein [Euryarchaeota archaeon]MBU4223060.1 DUF1186 domain-containing protein [Euryarchaeota archaeon]MBU4340821.1 DUF1186 domain-containing protein [Euryarchaeota archaeon]MCG2735680.1 DUF1186 domain-containing protein [Candidatus Methanoperedenaceae archaeon]